MFARLTEDEIKSVNRLIIELSQTPVSRLCGIVLAKENLEGTHLTYLADSDGEPKIFTTTRSFRQKLKRLIQDGESDWMPYFWAHEDCHYKPSSKYLKMTGNRFPGSVRR